jgi:glyoxylase-like metal-dependent hydrolase (beta-lactamase superfamily II)/rhodanese-related sulfurtransferase
VAEIVTIRDRGLGNSSYLIDLGDGRGLVVDPSRDPGPYLAAARRRGLRLAYTAETRLHADFVSGARELAQVGAVVLAPRAAALAFPHQGLGDGDQADLGGLVLRALATPGHTPEHLAFMLADGARPLALFSGGSLLVGAVARTDLISPDRTEELARALWRSLHERILTLPDDLAVYPTHGAGSFCSAPTGVEPTTTIGREKQVNPLLAAPDEDGFVKLLLEGLGSYPRYFLRLREVNRRGPALYGPQPPPLAPLDPQQVRDLLADGAELIDARPIHDFATGHVPAALSIPLRSAFATWLGWLVDDDRPLVVVLNADQDRGDLVRQCLKVGYERLAGELAGGMKAWRSAGLPEVRIEIAEVANQPSGTVLDVRQQGEFAAGHLPGARHVELGVLASGDELPMGPLAVMCAHGERAMTAASLLQRAGRGDLTVLVGGADDWARATGRSLERS